MKIYTKTGDQGETSLFAGGRVRKDHARVEAYGTVDELNSLLGLVRSYELPAQAETWLEAIQNTLFVIGADLATPMDSHPKWLVRLDERPTAALEQAIDQMDADLPRMTAFILPGGVTSAATLHVARTVCRRAERVCVALAADEPINPLVIVYLNRLSDFLFTLARWVNLQAGETETKWLSRG
ncbi:MAG: cob(I)yrinic acid a,c-diamide adenosyltransferase [Anaerolineae bacterium]|nr:cob(I)yrinic acid a,c-diamide adenosyltransferase [Anaerolineae bacterium]MDW8170915.1 cob(I)yrinic acid a,c-diamide adenosyltransferase [Anaerolineae bacterium]